MPPKKSVERHIHRRLRTYPRNLFTNSIPRVRRSPPVSAFVSPNNVVTARAEPDTFSLGDTSRNAVDMNAILPHVEDLGDDLNAVTSMHVPGPELQGYIQPGTTECSSMDNEYPMQVSQLEYTAYLLEYENTVSVHPSTTYQGGIVLQSQPIYDASPNNWSIATSQVESSSSVLTVQAPSSTGFVVNQSVPPQFSHAGFSLARYPNCISQHMNIPSVTVSSSHSWASDGNAGSDQSPEDGYSEDVVYSDGNCTDYPGSGGWLDGNNN